MDHTWRIVAIDHVQLAMPPGAEDQARDFYVRRLGFTEVPKPPALAARGGCWFERGAVQIHVGVEADFRPARTAHPALLIDGLDALIAAAELEPRWSAEIPGTRRCHLDDPFGNRLELIDAAAAVPPDLAPPDLGGSASQGEPLSRRDPAVADSPDLGGSASQGEPLSRRDSAAAGGAG